MNNLDVFATEYTKQLTIAVNDHPEDYYWSKTATVESVAEKMRSAFERKSYNKDGRAIKATCKALNIPYTYKGINDFIAVE
jgi:hypothetical protein